MSTGLYPEELRAGLEGEGKFTLAFAAGPSQGDMEVLGGRDGCCSIK